MGVTPRLTGLDGRGLLSALALAVALLIAAAGEAEVLAVSSGNTNEVAILEGDGAGGLELGSVVDSNGTFLDAEVSNFEVGEAPTDVVPGLSTATRTSTSWSACAGRHDHSPAR